MVWMWFKEKCTQDCLITFQMHHSSSLPSLLLGCDCLTGLSCPKISLETKDAGTSWRMFEISLYLTKIS